MYIFVEVSQVTQTKTSIGGGVVNAVDLSSTSERSAGSIPAQCICLCNLRYLYKAVYQSGYWA